MGSSAGGGSTGIVKERFPHEIPSSHAKITGGIPEGYCTWRSHWNIYRRYHTECTKNWIEINSEILISLLRCPYCCKKINFNREPVKPEKWFKRYAKWFLDKFDASEYQNKYIVIQCIGFTLMLLVAFMILKGILNDR